MFVTHLRVDGVRHADGLVLDQLGSVVRVAASPVSTAIGDALMMAAGALDPSRRFAVALGLGFDPDPIVEPQQDDRAQPDDDGDVQLAGLDPDAVRAVVGDARSPKIEITVRLDPILYGRLREQSARDPRVVTALSQKAELTVSTGWLFSHDRRFVAPSALSLRVGEVSFPIAGKDRPAWVLPLLADLGARFARLEGPGTEAALAKALVSASLSPKTRDRSGYRRMITALQQPPHSLPRLELLRSGGDGAACLAFGDDLVRARQLGWRALHAVTLCQAALLWAPDVLVVDGPLSEEHVSWLAGCTDGDDATLEQVFAP